MYRYVALVPQQASCLERMWPGECSLACGYPGSTVGDLYLPMQAENPRVQALKILSAEWSLMPAHFISIDVQPTEPRPSQHTSASGSA